MPATVPPAGQPPCSSYISNPAKAPISMNVLSLSMRYWMRSRAVSLFFWCCFSAAAFPPPSMILSNRDRQPLTATRRASSFLLKSRVSAFIERQFSLFLAGMTFRINFRRKITWVCLFAVAVAIKVFSFFPGAVEKYYSRGIYPIIAWTQRVLLGWVPFSVGDLVYGVVVVVVLVWLVRSIRKLRRGEAGKDWGWRLVRRVVFVVLWVYVLFNVLWGLNYDRLGI